MHSNDSMCVAVTKIYSENACSVHIFSALLLRLLFYFLHLLRFLVNLRTFFSVRVLLHSPDYMRMSTVINLCVWIFDSLVSFICAFRCNFDKVHIVCVCVGCSITRRSSFSQVNVDIRGNVLIIIISPSFRSKSNNSTECGNEIIFK